MNSDQEGSLWPGYLGYAFVFFAGVGWGLFLSSHWIEGAITHVWAFVFLAWYAVETRGSDASDERQAS